MDHTSVGDRGISSLCLEHFASFVDNLIACRVVNSIQLPAKIAAYLASIGWLLCLAFLCGWCFLNKISLDWLLTLTTQPSISKFSDNPEHVKRLLGSNLIIFFSLISG